MTCEVRIQAAPARVWELVTDIHVPARPSPEPQRMEWIDGAAGPAVGAAFAGYNRHPLLGEWRTVSRAVELREPRVFGWVVLDRDGRFAGSGPAPAEPMACRRFESEPDGSGTHLRQSVPVGPGRSRVSLAIDRMPDREDEVVAHRLGELRVNIDASLRGMKVLAEADGRPAPRSAWGTPASRACPVPAAPGPVLVPGQPMDPVRDARTTDGIRQGSPTTPQALSPPRHLR